MRLRTILNLAVYVVFKSDETVLAEAIFGVSGVLAVVILGAVLSSEKTSISPEVERFLHR